MRGEVGRVSINVAEQGARDNRAVNWRLIVVDSLNTAWCFLVLVGDICIASL